MPDLLGSFGDDGLAVTETPATPRPPEGSVVEEVSSGYARLVGAAEAFGRSVPVALARRSAATAELRRVRDELSQRVANQRLELEDVKSPVT